MALILQLNSSREAWWRDHLQSLLPDIECRTQEDPGSPEEIEFAVVWRPRSGWLSQFPNLKCIVSVGAGIDHVLADPQLPKSVPIIRTTGDDLTQRMREYVCLHVLRLHRRLMDIEAAQRQKIWRQAINPPAHERRVGIMGLGKLGKDAAKALTAIGFDVAGWVRRGKHIDKVSVFKGDSGLRSFLERSDILVCMLPLTDATEGILNRDLIAHLPPDACLINVGRGEHLIEEDLLDGLESGKLAYATLDVFRQEPLPENHPFWTHPKVLVTPHVASMIDPVAGGKEIANNITKFIRGEPLGDLVDLERGY